MCARCVTRLIRRKPTCPTCAACYRAGSIWWRRRCAGGAPARSAELVGRLPSILADDAPRQQAFGLGRHQATEPTNAGASRRAEEKLAAVDVTDLGSRSDEELRELLEILRKQERDVSDTRRRVQAVFDSASAELTRRYRDGEADVNALLAEEAGTGSDS